MGQAPRRREDAGGRKEEGGRRREQGRGRREEGPAWLNYLRQAPRLL